MRREKRKKHFKIDESSKVERMNLTLQQWRAKSTHIIQKIIPTNMDTMNQLEYQLTDHIYSNKVEIGKLKEQIDYLEEFVTNLKRADPQMSK